MRIILLTLLVLVFVQFIHPQNGDFKGIKFNSQNVEKSGKTSIFLNDDNPIELKNSFSISFDISFWDYKEFGPILRIQDSDGNEFRIVYSPFKNRDTSVIELIEPFNQNSISVRLPRKNLIRNNWFNLKFSFDKSRKKIEVFYNNSLVGSLNYNAEKRNEYRFVFGIKDFKNSRDFDVPAISIKNIIISENNNVKYYWELNPFKENPLTDKISNSKIKVLNPVWLYQDHQKWKNVADFKISNSSMNHFGVAFDSINYRLFIDRSNDLLIYDLVSGKDSIIKYKSKSPAFWNDLFYDYSKQLLYSYFTAMGKVSIYDLSRNQWTVFDTSKNPNGYYFGSAKFSYPNDDDLFLLGGYGWYKTKNELFKYNFAKREWNKVKLKKNEMTPRAWFTFGKGFKDGEYLIYGGFGNETGNQELGFHINYDLFLLNMNDSTITKLKLPEQKFNYDMLFNNAYLDKEDSSFYFLSQNEEGKGITISLNNLDLRTGKVAPLGNKFWKRRANKWMYSYLHYNKATNEFISVLFDTTTVEVFAISYPPISGTEKTYLNQIKSTDYSSLIIFISTGIGLAVILVIYVRKRKVNHSSPLSIKEIDNIVTKSGSSVFLNSIQLFGGFYIYDNQGRNIISDFSPKLKEILLLILLKSFNHYQHKGITSEELSSIIWPDASPESVKSSRGVAINKIRKLLSSVNGVDLEFSDKLWFIRINNGAKCDYVELLKFIDAAKNGIDQEVNSLSSLIIITQNGEFLKGISYEWLDSIKFSINNEAIGFIKHFFESEELKSDPEKTIKLCDIILSFDPVDMDAIKLKIKTLSNQGKLHIAKSTYNLFVSDYKRLYDEHYPLTFQEIISS